MNPGSDPADIHSSPRQEPRLPPGQVLTEKWPVLHHGSVPATDLAAWDFRVFGLVERPSRWTWKGMQALTHCVTRWSRYDNLWSGFSVRDVIAAAGPTPEGRFAIVHAEQGFTANLPLSELLQDDVLLADMHDGRPLSPDHGWPLRLVVPRRYFWKSAKWVRGFEVVAQDRPGFWEQNGYHNDADPWREERFSDW
jgi:DMSO/TMAO reductase YedYZ molybdopterin-dependent catalytic subunit